MLVQAPHCRETTHDTAFAAAFRVTGTSVVDPVQRGELQDLDLLHMSAVIDGIAQKPGTALSSVWRFDPRQAGPKLALSYSTHSDRNKGADRTLRLARQLEHALCARFEVAALAEDPAASGVDDGPVHTFSVESTCEASALTPMPGRWSGGRPLAVRDRPDFSMLLRLIATLEDAVVLHLSVRAGEETLHVRVDEARRAWELSQGVMRYDEASHHGRQRFGEGPQTDPTPTRPLAAATSATRWQTPALSELAEIAGSGGSVHLSLAVSSPSQEAACLVATACRDALFEHGTARVVDAAATSMDASGSLSDKARTLVRAQDAARLLTFPRIESPFLLPVCSSTQDDQPGARLGKQFDELVWNPSDAPVGMTWRSALQHLLVTGINGSGKTVSLLQLIAEAARADPAIPTLFISFAKDEGSGLLGWRSNRDRELRAYARQLMVYGPHPDAAQPIRLNPFALPNADPQEVADEVYRVIKSGIALDGPLGANVLEACLRMVRGGKVAILSDLPDAVRRVQQDKGYSADVRRDLGGAFESRISELTSGLSGAIFRAGASSPTVEDVLERPHVLALGRVDVEIASMCVVDFLRRLERHLIHTGSSAFDGRPRLIIVLDEVQIVAPRDSAYSAGGKPVVSAEAARLIRHAVKVLRALGVVVVLASQHPGSIDEELVKAVGGHVCLAQNQTAEKNEIAGLLGLDGRQVAQLGGLPRGHAFYRGPGMAAPQRVVIPFEPGVHDLGPIDDNAVAAHCAASSHARTNAIQRCRDELALRESRFVATAKRLNHDRRDLRGLASARRVAEAETRRAELARQTLREVDQAEAVLRHQIDRRGRLFECEWARTLRPIPDWLTGWAELGSGHARQRRDTEALIQRHARLVRAYRRLSARSTKHTRDE